MPFPKGCPNCVAIAIGVMEEEHGLESGSRASMTLPMLWESFSIVLKRIMTTPSKLTYK